MFCSVLGCVTLKVINVKWTTFFLRNSKRYIHFHNLLLNEPRTIKNMTFSTSRFFDVMQGTQLANEPKVRELIEEIEGNREKGTLMPVELKFEDVEELLTLPTKSQRSKYLKFLCGKEARRCSHIAKKEIKKSLRNKLEEENKILEIDEKRVFKNTLFALQAKRVMKKKVYLNRMIHAMLFGQKLVIDLSYDEHMRRADCYNCACQLKLVRSANMAHRYPYNLYFCNANEESVTVKKFRTDNKLGNDLYVNYTHSSYLDIFPRENLVYLSPHAEEALEQYDHEAIYIIGGFVDKTFVGNISSEKAKREGIKSYCLPLNDHVKWKTGSKSLTLDQMIQIMLEMKTSGDWNKALRSLPLRKIY